jgi:hypothetical protein
MFCWENRSTLQERTSAKPKIEQKSKEDDEKTVVIVSTIIPETEIENKDYFIMNNPSGSGPLEGYSPKAQSIAQ